MRRGPTAVAALVAVLITGALAVQPRQAQSGPCTALTIALSEEKSALLAQLAADFQRTGPPVQGHCLSLRIIRKASGEVEQALARGWDAGEPAVGGSILRLARLFAYMANVPVSVEVKPVSEPSDD